VLLINVKRAHCLLILFEKTSGVIGAYQQDFLRSYLVEPSWQMIVQSVFFLHTEMVLLLSNGKFYRFLLCTRLCKPYLQEGNVC